MTYEGGCVPYGEQVEHVIHCLPFPPSSVGEGEGLRPLSPPAEGAGRWLWVPLGEVWRSSRSSMTRERSNRRCGQWVWLHFDNDRPTQVTMNNNMQHIILCTYIHVYIKQIVATYIMFDCLYIVVNCMTNTCTYTS